MKKKNVCDTIALLLSKNASYLKENNLKGKLGLSAFLFQYAKLSRKPHYSDLAFEVLDYAINKELLLEINASKLDFLNGITGIGVFMIFMLEENYFETDLNEILTLIDKRIYVDIEKLTRTNEKKNIIIFLSLLTYLKYRKNKSTFFTEYERLLNEEAILLTEISIQFLIQNNSYEIYSSFFSIINEIIPIENDSNLIAISNLITEKGTNQSTKKHSLKNRLEHKILSLYFKKKESNKDDTTNQKLLLTEILSNQKNTPNTYLNLINLGLLSLNVNNGAMRLFWNFMSVKY